MALGTVRLLLLRVAGVVLQSVVAAFTQCLFDCSLQIRMMNMWTASSS
jgi:hypothetical protein